MTGTFFRSLGRVSIISVVLLMMNGVALVRANTPEPDADDDPDALPIVVTQPWTGDLDGMIERRMIRVLVTYSKTHYFVDRGNQLGLTYEMGRLLEDKLNKDLKRKHNRVHVYFIPTSRDDLIPALLEGRGDIGAANLTITPERQQQVDFSDPTFRNVSELVVIGPSSKPIASLDDLAGRELFIRRSSSFHASVERLNEEFARAGKQPVRVKLAPEDLQTEDILEMVNAGLVKATIADSHMTAFWKRVLPKIVVTNVAVRSAGDIGVMLRKDSPLLRKTLNEFLAKPGKSDIRAVLLQKYMKSTKFVKNAASDQELKKFERTVELFRKYGDQYDLDYLLMMAQGYQESRLDQNAKSPVGAIGIMQVMPATGADMKVGSIHDLEANVHAGVKYTRFMIDQFYAKEPMDALNKGLFAFASYNAGPGRIRQLRRLTAKRGLNPNIWFNNVEVLAGEKIGRETVTYVSNIYKYYVAYSLIEGELEQRRQAREALTKKPQ